MPYLFGVADAFFNAGLFSDWVTGGTSSTLVVTTEDSLSWKVVFTTNASATTVSLVLSAETTTGGGITAGAGITAGVIYGDVTGCIPEGQIVNRPVPCH